MCYDGFENLTRMQGMKQWACRVLYHVKYKDSVTWYWWRRWYREKILFYFTFRLKSVLKNNYDGKQCTTSSKQYVLYIVHDIWFTCVNWRMLEWTHVLTYIQIIGIGNRYPNKKVNHIFKQNKDGETSPA